MTTISKSNIHCFSCNSLIFKGDEMTRCIEPGRLRSKKGRWVHSLCMPNGIKTEYYMEILKDMKEDYPDTDFPVIDEGKNAGVIGQGGLLLARIPEEIVEERNQYFMDKTNTQMEAVDRDLMKESNPAMPISKERKSQVAFGGKRQS